MDLNLLALLPRQDEGAADAPPPSCDTGNEFDGRLGLRISSVFVILVGSMLGAVFPVWSRPNGGGGSRLGVPSWAFFIAKFFGSGVIVATAFIHLLAPAHEALSNECLTGPITEYPWVEGIMLMTIVLLFFLELMVMRYARFGEDHPHHVTDNERNNPSYAPVDLQKEHKSAASTPDPATSNTHIPGEDHLGHSREHHPDPSSPPSVPPTTFNNDPAHAFAEDYAAQLTSIFILEFGIIFHSIFIGLTLAVSGEEFVTLYIVLVFHQTFEGLGLGSRLAAIPWPKSKHWTPYLLGIGYGLSTPIAIAIGLGVRNTYPPEGHTTLIVNGVFDSVSAGILVYTALVELMAHEFMFSTSMRRAGIRTVLAAFGLLCLGAALMALLGKWA